MEGTVDTVEPTTEQAPVTEPVAAPVEPVAKEPVTKEPVTKEPVKEPSLLDTNAENNLLSQNTETDFSGLKVPEGSHYTDAELDGLKAFAAEKGFSPAQTQDLLERELSTFTKMKETLTNDWEGTQNDWKQALKEDKEYGGVNTNRTLRLAKTTLDKFGNPELNQLLEDGVQHHPGVLKLLADVANAISEDSSIQKSTPVKKDVSQADVLFG